ncbi:hypothetical protein AXX17_AT1G13660 [Arabidopsis thaliana]|uniref:F-box domain-containing protein n=1 Tax=Arabidopsis thaliana TaxID=3702 RepID=A0A178WLU3_ARATH|nr:hypothetical protein AXX17_AT1G13660 [Arabidopsis thaliana]
MVPSSLPNDVLEEIFLRFPVKALIRLKSSLSKQWRSTIESRSFEERHLTIGKKAFVDHPKVMLVGEEDPLRGTGIRPDTDIGFRLFCLESASLLSFTRLNFPQGFFNWIYISESYFLRQAFVKATDYKLVWLYNCDKYIADASSPNVGVTKCEIFDFRKNAWRYLACTPSHRIFYYQKPASANGSVYWFTEPYNERIEVVAFDIHTETFRLLPKINPAIAGSDPHHIDMCTLDNSLSMSKREKDTMIQDIWRLKPSEDTWEKIFSIPVLLLGLRSVINLIGARRIGLSQPHPSRFVRIRRSFSHIAIPEVW